MAPLIAGAGLLTVLAPLVAAAVLPWAADLGPRIGSLVASAAIFFLPALLLATVSPLAVRLAAAAGMERIGRSAGSLYAISTAGSIVGTLATSFWLIPALSLSPLIVAIGFLLFGCALASLALPVRTEATGAVGRTSAEASLGRLRRRSRSSLAGAVAGGWVLARVAPVSATNESGEAVLFRADTQYHRITVTEADNIRHLRFDATNQSAIDLSDGYRSTIAYPNYFDLALAIKPDAKRVLVLGLGGGAVTKRWWRDYPDMTIDSVEIDPVVVDVSRRFFGLPDDARLEVFTDRRAPLHPDDRQDLRRHHRRRVLRRLAAVPPDHARVPRRGEVADGARRRARLQRDQPRRRRAAASCSARPTGRPARCGTTSGRSPSASTPTARPRSAATSSSWPVTPT